MYEAQVAAVILLLTLIFIFLPAWGLWAFLKWASKARAKQQTLSLREAIETAQRLGADVEVTHGALGTRVKLTYHNREVSRS